jgi:ketosteroid isomerase-like protein
MGLRCLLIGTAILILAVQARADTAEEVEDAVRTIQRAFNKGDVDTLKGLMTEDLTTTLTYARFSSAADQLKVLSDWKFSEYKIDGLKVKPLTKDVALVSFTATIKGTYKGKQVPSPVQVGEVWVRRDGKWKQASYQETPLDEK